MMTLFGEQQSWNSECSKGWSDRCRKAKSSSCTCACGGENHGKNRIQTKGTVEQSKMSIIESDSKGKMIGIFETRQVFLNGNEILPDDSQEIINHSPDGFSWGYGGSGCAQLALAICLLLLKNKKEAQSLYQDFKWHFVAKLPQKDFEVSSHEVFEALDRIKNQMSVKATKF